NSGCDTQRPWEESINPQRREAQYFLSIKNIPHARPAGYFEYRDMDAFNQRAIVDEWNGWMKSFEKNQHKALVELSLKDHKTTAAVTRFLLKKVHVSRKMDMMAASKEQLRDNETEMTGLLRTVSLPSGSLPSKKESPWKGKKLASTFEAQDEIFHKPTSNVAASTSTPTASASASASTSTASASTSISTSTSTSAVLTSAALPTTAASKKTVSV
ncbi:hypothetical protein BG004_008366, partial [Podila humilis]